MVRLYQLGAWPRKFCPNAGSMASDMVRFLSCDKEKKQIQGTLPYSWSSLRSGQCGMAPPTHQAGRYYRNRFSNKVVQGTSYTNFQYLGPYSSLIGYGVLLLA